RCGAGWRGPKRWWPDPRPPGWTGTNTCAPCSPRHSNSPPANERARIQGPFRPPLEWCSATSFGSGWIQTTSPAPESANPVPAARCSTNSYNGWSAYDDAGADDGG